MKKYNSTILKKLRKKRNLSQEGAIKLMRHEVHLDISRTTLDKWEKGITCPDIKKHIPALCVFYDISVFDLVTNFFGLKRSKVNYVNIPK